MQRGAPYNIHNIIKPGITNYQELWDILLAFQGTSIDEESPSKYHKEMIDEELDTGLHPVMTFVVANEVKKAVVVDGFLIVCQRQEN